MKASELVKGIQAMIDAYGDLPISIAQAVQMDDMKEDEPITIIASREINLAYDQYDEKDGGDEINIRNFIY